MKNTYYSQAIDFILSADSMIFMETSIPSMKQRSGSALILSGYVETHIDNWGHVVDMDTFKIVARFKQDFAMAKGKPAYNLPNCITEEEL